MKKTLSIIALAGTMTGLGAQVASAVPTYHVGKAPTYHVGLAQTAEKPTKDGWTWFFADGSHQGPLTKPGYHMECAVIPDSAGKARYGAAYAPGSWSAPVFNLTLNQVQALIKGQFTKDGKGDEPRIWWYMFNNGVETKKSPNPTPGELNECDWVKNGMTIPGTTNDGKTNPVPVKPTPKPAVKTKTLLVQIDRTTPKNAKAANLLAKLDDDRKMTRPESRPLWSNIRETWQFARITVPVNPTATQVIAAVNKASDSKVGDISTTERLASIKPGQTVTTAWIVTEPSASAKAPFGRTGLIAQSYIGRSAVR